MKSSGIILYSVRWLIIMAFASASIYVRAEPDEEYHSFTDTSGREIEARVLGYDPESGKVALQLSNGNKGVVVADQLSAEDRSYLKQWQAAQPFLDNQQLEINISFVKGRWQKNGRVDKRDDYFEVSLVNHGSGMLTNVQAEYCEYFRRQGRDDYIATLYHTFEIGDIAPHKAFETQQQTASYRTNESVGSRFRFRMKMADGTVLTREVCVPQSLPAEDYRWLPDPTAYPEKEMTEEEVRALAQSYIAAWTDDDFEAWRTLMLPMYPTSNMLIEEFFEIIEENIDNIRVVQVEDRNVKLEIESDSGNRRTGWLMITPSGHIKYAPLRFSHPMTRMPSAVSYLLDSREDMRITGKGWLENDGVPISGYDINNSDTWEASALQVLDWVRDNGASHDASEPRLFMPEEEILALIAEAEVRLNRSPGR